MNQKTVEQKFKKLSEVEHVLARPGRYVGSIAIQDSIEFIPDATTKKMTKRQASYSPGFLKLFDEIITNSADHSRTAEGKHLDIVRVDVDPVEGTISVYDNGGIPVVKHTEYNQWVPEMIFELRSGSNFNDDDHADLAGQNGEGAALTCIFSEFFTVETCDGKKKFKMTFTDNSQTRPAPKVSDADGHKGYTRITYKPELDRLNMESIDEDAVAMLYARTVEIAATNTHLKVYFNGERIMTRSFKDYVEMFDPTGEADIVFDDTEFFKVAVMQSEDGFQHTSFVSCTHTKTGGTHVTYVVNQIVDAVRDFIKKKYKVEVRPADVRNHLHLFIDCRIINPRYSSQTKDDLITEVSAWGSGRTWSVPDKFIQKLLKTQIIQSIMDWVEAKANAEAMKDLRKANKDQSKFDPRKVDKFSDAMEKKDRKRCVVYFAEGDSAAKSIQGGRGKNPYIASFPLKGKPLNVRDKDVTRVLGIDKKKEKEANGKKVEPNEIQKILMILGLQIGVPVTSLDELRFGKMAIATDADVDGFHICGLLINIIDKFWPELFTMGFVTVLRTPVIVVTLKDKSQIEFFTERQFNDWESTTGSKTKGWSKSYYKGLSKWKTEQFAKFLEKPEDYLFAITTEDEEDTDAIDLAFNATRANDRKDWLETQADNFEDHIIG